MVIKGTPKIIFSLIVPILILLTVLPIDTVHADIGPKPSMEFEFESETNSTFEILDGVQLECALPDCSDAEPLEEMGPQSFSCGPSSCSSLAYGYSEHHRLRIRFGDGKTRESNIFTSDSFSMTYRVLVRENDLIIEKVRGRSNPMGLVLVGLIFGGLVAILLSIALLILVVVLILRAGENKAEFETSRWLFVILWIVMAILLIFASYFYLAIPVTVVVEAILALVYIRIKKSSIITTLTMVVLANMLTLPILWMGANFVGSSNSFLILIVAEIIIWLVECVILYLTQRKTVLFKEMLLLSFVLNLASFLVGLLLPL